MQNRSADFMVDRLALLDASNESSHLPNEHGVVEFDKINTLVAEVNFADNLVVEWFVVGIGLFVLGLDFVEFNVYL